TLTSYLAAIPDGEAKDRGVKLGEDVAAKMLALRADDGSKAPNGYRPITQPGAYIPTTMTIGWECITMVPFAMESPSQFRPGPPPDLKGPQWAKDYNGVFLNLCDARDHCGLLALGKHTRIWRRAP